MRFRTTPLALRWLTTGLLLCASLATAADWNR